MRNALVTCQVSILHVLCGIQILSWINDTNELGLGFA